LRDAGIPVRTEQHGDVNGIAWGAVDGMRRAGIDRLVMALNPDHGRPPFEQPSGFWWESPAGGRVFTWLSTHYGFGEEWGIVDGDVVLAEQRILEFIEGLEGRDDYPFDTAVVHAGNDNRWPTTLFLDVVRHWNAQHPERPLSTATIDTALDALVGQAGDPGSGVLPVARGEWSDWWSHGHGSTAREVAVYREARTFAQSAATSLALTRLRGDGQPALATVLGYRRGPARLRTDDEVIDELAGVDRELLLFGEHTWGSWETYSKPHSFFSHSHWNAKAGFAYGAFDWARDLAIEGVYRYAASGCGSSGQAGETGQTAETGATHATVATDATGASAETPGDSILVFNPTERDRREPVEVEIGGARRVTIVAEAGGFGVTAIPIPDATDAPRAGRTFETDRYRLEVDPDRGGVVSLVELASGLELVDRASAHGLGAIVVEQVAEGSTHPMLTNPKEFSPAHPGPEFVRSHAASDAEPSVVETPEYTRIAWESGVPGPLTATHTLTVYRETELIDVAVRIRKPENFAPESIFVAFPFAVDEPEFLLETAGAVYAAETEQLPDTSKDWYSIQHAVGVRGQDAAVLWGSFDAPLVQLGGIHTGEWARALEAPVGHVNSWAMNNLHFTNFQARQEFTGTLRYRFRPAPVEGLRDAVRAFGRALAVPLQARQYAGPVSRAEAPVRVEPAERVFVELRPVAGAGAGAGPVAGSGGAGGVRVRLRNATGEPVEATVTVAGVAHPVSLTPHAVADLTLR
jgi:alpha-mannosidase